MKAYFKKDIPEVGCDEAGRGCLAGPVVAAAVILPTNFDLPFLNDSKKLTEKKRRVLKSQIEEQALFHAVGICSPKEIDEINILWASFKAMHKALDQIPENSYEHILVDGNRFVRYHEKPHHCIIKGDAKFASIAAASILAKTYRDDFMEKIHEEHPYYEWNKNKGYPTKKHRAGIMKFGPSDYHRKSFTLLPPQLKLSL